MWALPSGAILVLTIGSLYTRWALSGGLTRYGALEMLGDFKLECAT
jgi:hypothetical protein